jgi:cysteinyl-tRNA synthetase
MADLEGTFVEALGRGETRAAVGALLDLDAAITARVRHGEDSPDLDNAAAMFRALIARLGEQAESGPRDPRDAVAPFVEALLELRARARAAGDWPAADLVRDRLAAAGVEVRDGPDGSTWHLDDAPPG